MMPILPGVLVDAGFPDPAHTSIVASLLDTLKARMADMAVAHLAGDIEARYRHFEAATETLEDLYVPLDHESDDEWTKQTAALYRFVFSELSRAVVENDPSGIQQANVLMEPVRLAWHALDAQSRLAGLSHIGGYGAKSEGLRAAH